MNQGGAGGGTGGGGPEVLAPWDPMNMNPNNMDPAQAAAWRERERRQRTIRLLMMFLLMLLLMDSEDQAGRKGNKSKHTKNRPKSHLSTEVFGARLKQENQLLDLTQGHPRFKELVEKNQGKNIPLEVQRWAEQQSEVVKDEFVGGVVGGGPGGTMKDQSSLPEEVPKKDPEEDVKVFHYPWNATGFYRGEWIREIETNNNNNDADGTDGAGGEAGSGGEDGKGKPKKGEDTTSTKDGSGSDKTDTAVQRKMESSGKNAINEDTTDPSSSDHIPTQYVDALSFEEESEMQQIMKHRKEGLGVFLLPPGKEVILRYDHSNFTSYDWDKYSTAPKPKQKGAEHHYFMKTSDLDRFSYPSSPNLMEQYFMGIGGSGGESSSRKGGSGSNLAGTTTKDVSSGTSSSSNNNNLRNKMDDFTADLPTIAGGAINPSTQTSKVTLTKGSGRAAFQLFSRSIPAMQEISLVDGFLKLYDSNMPGYSTHKDILLRVRGVLIHGIGRMSLVSNAGPGRSVLVLGDDTLVDLDGNEDENISDGGGGSDDATTKEAADLGHRRRRLMETLTKLQKDDPNHKDSTESNIKTVRDDALALFDDLGSEKDGKGSGEGREDRIQFKFESLPDDEQQTQQQGKIDTSDLGSEDQASLEDGTTADGDEEEDDDDSNVGKPRQKIVTQRRTRVVSETVGDKEEEEEEAGAADRRYNQHEEEEDNARHHGQSGGTNAVDEGDSSSGAGKYTWSDIVIPYPFVLDDEDETIRKTKTPAARKMPPREQLLERNAGICEFEVTMDTKEVEWTVGEWRKLVGRRVKESMDLNPANQPLQPESEDSGDGSRSMIHSGSKSHRMGYGSSSSKSSKSSRERQNRKPIQDQALIMKMTGSILSPNCDFTAQLNVTALRTDWEHTTGKAINYSFYMMLTCLTQIMVLLRQLLHTQAQSAATRVSLLCIGWQTVLDALLCLGHIYLSLAMQPLFTAFASVAFFKLLIFCVIEMKYMALIIQARNSSNGGNTTELLRRQVAMLHLRFYVALFGAFLAFFYAGEKFRIPYNLALYSFWVPQIVQNVITEAKRPMHHYYIYGMSLTRLVAPLYVFGESNNFLKEVYPESPTDLYMCELLVLWVGIQTAVLIAQGKYGARFMIPARFLPPKFDYSRPIPPSLLPPGTTQDMTPDLPLQRQPRNSETSQTMQDSQSLLSNDPVVLNRHTTGVTTRNRIKGSRARQETGMTTETVVNDTSAQPSCHTLDCVICYNAIDVHNRRGYMLAPCDHIFHRDCLLEWMNVKMECPICRTELPSI